MFFFIILAPGLTRNWFFLGKSAKKNPKPVMIFWSILSVYSLLKVVGY